eukprot:1827080-Amphidinium_carterae.2
MMLPEKLSPCQGWGNHNLKEKPQKKLLSQQRIAMLQETTMLCVALDKQLFVSNGSFAGRPGRCQEIR